VEHDLVGQPGVPGLLSDADPARQQHVLAAGDRAGLPDCLVMPLVTNV
jgi:hypothetical protein